MATQQAKASMEPSILERVGDKFNSFVEGCVNLIARLLGGSSNERIIKSLGYLRPKSAEAHAVTPGSILDRINVLEPQMQTLSDEELSGITPKLKERLAKGELGIEFYGLRAKLAELGVEYVEELVEENSTGDRIVVRS